ncbi:MAG: hypothetical protein U0136_00350 [Bdellovibrionota bacterium]
MRNDSKLHCGACGTASSEDGTGCGCSANARWVFDPYLQRERLTVSYQQLQQQQQSGPAWLAHRTTDSQHVQAEVVPVEEESAYDSRHGYRLDEIRALATEAV